MRYGLRDMPDRLKALYQEEKGLLGALAASVVVVGISTVAALYGYQQRCAPVEEKIVVEPLRRCPSPTPTPVPFFLEGQEMRTTSDMSTVVESEYEGAARKLQQMQADALLSSIEN